MIEQIAIGIVAGIVVESIAKKYRIWIYRSTSIQISNIVLVFGIAAGVVASSIENYWLMFLLMTLFGYVYELVNIFFCHWWRFENDRIGVIRGNAAICVALAFVWGVLPVGIALISGLV